MHRTGRPGRTTNTVKAVAFDNFGFSSTSTPVTVIVDQSPSVSVTSPANNAVFGVNDPITINATATDAVGIARVELRNAGVVIGTVTNQPYSFTWNGAPVGTNALTARAINQLGVAVISSPSISVIVTNIAPGGSAVPVVTITSPSGSPTLVGPGSSMTITATATSSSGTITNIQLFANNNLWKQTTTLPLTYTASALVTGLLSTLGGTSR